MSESKSLSRLTKNSITQISVDTETKNLQYEAGRLVFVVTSKIHLLLLPLHNPVQNNSH